VVIFVLILAKPLSETAQRKLVTHYENGSEHACRNANSMCLRNDY